MKIDDAADGVIKVWVVTIGAITIGQIITALQVAAPLVAISYTLWRWRRDKQNADREDNERNH